jgi:type IV pilus assembly protein PilX
MSASRHQSGFILVTSLLILLVLTLLALSAINSATLQQRMATNQRGQSRALNAANSTLRYIETRLEANDFCAIPSDCGKDPATAAVTITNSSGSQTATGYLASSFWSGASHYKPAESPSAYELEVQYVVEYMGQKASIMASASASTGQRFRITARAHGRAPAGHAIVQSIYQVPDVSSGDDSASSEPDNSTSHGRRLAWHEIRR